MNEMIQQSALPGKPVASVYNKLSLLVIDDHRTMVEIIKGLLQQIGFAHIDTAMDGQKGLELLVQRKYDLVISDWNMPVMDGLELLKRVRSSTNPQIKAVPFILLTAESKTDNIIAAKQAGVNNYIIKPMTQAVLKQKIDTTLGIL
jgi:two-component system chemotaxis response regulator CheY